MREMYLSQISETAFVNRNVMVKGLQHKVTVVLQVEVISLSYPIIVGSKQQY